ncbi:DUF982 domain-containing protein [Phyllobacterium salinisoli]|uniref:DUF982 domain-containing protein n=1 Tax=Phyllobacterium salinisoli TaxID=1899321 RepID=A0A368K2V9_9HYPH|nr:DUF982 domain-containing protein [Phyllobacterium salinisoli]RCS22965.1 DUF982 domain-containing protein [Phyllobacterium salinisoli]
MKWTSPIAIQAHDVYHSISGTKDAEIFILGNWCLFKHENLNTTIMACLLSYDGNVDLAERARLHFIEAVRSAGILVCDGEQPQTDAMRRAA